MPILAAAFIAEWHVRMAAVLAAVSVGLVRVMLFEAGQLKRGLPCFK